MTNKIKHISLYCLILGFVLFENSCIKKLDQLPKATADKNSVFSTEQGLELYINSLYEVVPGPDDIFQGDNMSDYGVRKDIPDFLRPGLFTPIQGEGWNWESLRNINYFINNCTDNSVSVDVRQNYIGIARFFRAWWYFKMVKKFGDVPWIGKPLDVKDSLELFKPRDPRTLVMDSVLSDLNYACNNITLKDDPSCSRITKWVAFALKARICLFEGTFRKYHSEYNLSGTAEVWLNEAASAAKKVMDESGFEINQEGGPTQSYRNLFISPSPVKKEVMLADIVDPNLGVLTDAGWYWTSATKGDRLSFNRTFVNTYLNIDGTPFTDNPDYKTMTFVEETMNRDTRLQQTIRTPGYLRISKGKAVATPPAFSYTYTGYQPIKFAMDDDKYDQDFVSINSIPVFRYAEVLLNYAEAKAELGALTDEDWANTVGKLNARAGIINGLTAKPTKVDSYLQSSYFPDISAPAILEIRRCRSIELAWEGFRFDDLLRWKCGKLLEQEWNGMYVPGLNIPMDLNNDGTPDVCFVQGTPSNPLPGVQYVDVSPIVKGIVNPMLLSHDTYGEIGWLKSAPRVWNDKMYLYPIPESALLKNSKLGQNPGW